MLTFFKSTGARAAPASESAGAQTADESALAARSAAVDQEFASAEVASIHSVKSSASSPSKSSNVDAYRELSNAGHATPHAPSRSLTPVQPISVPLPQSSVHSLLVPSSPGFVADAESVKKTSALPGSNHYLDTKAGKDPTRFSFRSFAFLRSESKLPPSDRQHSLSIHTYPQTLPKPYEKEKKSRPSRTFTVRALHSRTSDKRARDTAALIRSVIVGDHELAQDRKGSRSKPLSKSDLSRVKAQLLVAKSASKVINHLHAMSPTNMGMNRAGPIRAVCLDLTDKEAHEHYFSKVGSVATATVAALSVALADVHIVDILTSDMGFGSPAPSPGLLAGAVSPDAIIDGSEQVPPHLVALGYATSNATPLDHKCVVVPVDRVSVVTYWWGFEVCMPPPTIEQLDASTSTGTALLNLLTALSVISPGVREVLPFIRFVAQFVQTEWRMLKSANKGKGIVCCATWIMPAVMVPRAWDFPDPPPATIVVGPGANLGPAVSRPPTVGATPQPSMDVQRASSAYSGETGEQEARPNISSDPPVLPELVVSSPASNESKTSIDLEVHKPSADVPRDADPFAL